MIQIEPYTSVLKMGVFDFTERCFSELGKRFEPEGRHGFYNDIENAYTKAARSLQAETEKICKQDHS